MLLSVPFDLETTLCCGQVFRWAPIKNWWFGAVGDHAVKVRQVGDSLEFIGANESLVVHYFSLDHDLPKIAKEIGKDDTIKAAIRAYCGLRLIRQIPWECLISFICATYKSVAAIRQMLQKLSAKFGEEIMLEEHKLYAFPSAKRLAKSTHGELESCGLGYRAKYVLKTAQMISKNPETLERIRELPYEEAKKALLRFPGVGLKVADCVLLFSLERLEAFPIDVWVKRVLLHYYSRHLDPEFVKKFTMQAGLGDSAYAILNQFGRIYFGKYAGYAQEYLYHYERRFTNRKLEKPNTV